MSLHIPAIAEKLNQLAPPPPIGKLQDIRTQLKKLNRRPGEKIFSKHTIFDELSWHPLGFVAAMKKLLMLMTLGAVAAGLAFASYKTTRWGGSYGHLQIEHELTFLDPSGKPIGNIELRVEDQRGNEFFCFPVTDCLPGQRPKSDKNGMMRFHHVSTAVEWDNYGWLLFWCFPVQTTRSPVYVCRFLLDGKEVHRVRYDDLPDWDWPRKGWEEVPKVKRRWNWPAMIPNEIQYKAEDTEESYYVRLKLFFNDNSEDLPTREVSIACRNARWLVEFKRSAEDIEFPVIRRSITIKLDGR